MEALKTLLGQVDDDYLIGLSNKGTIKRAYKDLEKETPVLTWQEESAQVALKEETCVIRVPLGESSCTCPSRSICRHILTAVLWLKRELAGKEAEGGEKSPKGQVSEEGKQPSTKSPAQSKESLKPAKQNMNPDVKNEFLALPLEKLKKACGSRSLKRFFAHIQAGETPSMEETSIVTVKLPWDRETVKLLEPLEYSTCTCHSRELCTHKAQALLYYQMKKGVLTLKDLESAGEEGAAFHKEQAAEAALSVWEALSLQLCTGLSRQSEEVMESLERLAVISHRALLASLESGLREMAGEYKEYLERSAAFREERLLQKLLEAYRRARGIAGAGSVEEIRPLAGKFRGTYEAGGTLRLMGFGVRSFSSKTGYEGEIYYFLETKKQEFYTWTDARPMFYEGVHRRRPASVENAPAPWGLSCSREQMTDLAFELREARAASGGRLSVSQETKGEITGVKSLCHEAVAPLIFWDYEEMLSHYYGTFAKGRERRENNAFPSGGRRERLALAGAVRWGETSFDEIEQRFSWTLYDEKGRKLFVALKYTREEKLTIALLERLEQRLRKRSYGSVVFFGALYLEEGRLCMYPIEFFLQEAGAKCPGKPDSLEGVSSGGETGGPGESKRTVPEGDILWTMEQYLGEAQRQLADVFVTGLDSVPDEMAQRLSACGEEGEALGLHQAGKELGLIGRLLGERRHQMEFSPEPVIEAMERFSRYLAACREKLSFDQALGAMTEEE